MCTKAMVLKSVSFPLFLLHLLNLTLAASSASDGEFTYNGFTAARLELDGMAMVTPGGLLLLTNGTSPLIGRHAFHPAPLRFHTSPNGTVKSFSTTFVFAMVCEHPGLCDHGFAFVVSPTKDLSAASVAQYLGLLNASDNGRATNHIFAVELDNILNSELQDINDNHVGVDVNDLRSVQSRTAGYYDDNTGAFQNLSLISGKAMQAWVDYDGQTMELNVTLAPVEVFKPRKPLLSAIVNLSTVLADPAYVGFSSAAGVLIKSSFYVLGWSFNLNGVAPPLDLMNLPTLPRIGSKPRSKVLEIVLPIAIVAFVIVLVAAIFLYVQRRLQYAELHEDWEAEFGPHRFSYKDLFHATRGFENKRLLGTGGFGRVYKGVLPASNAEIAVKRVSHDSKQGMKEFVAEVVSIGRLCHRNLVQLLGYCRRSGELLLVYDYMSNGSLDKYLYSDDKPIIDWAQRFRIIKGIASGLLYLHEDWEKVVIHRDVKASNVLLDSDMNGRLGDFGLARLYDHGTDPETSHIVGTRGYLAPELVRTGKPTPMTDVFAFGMFLLEVTCGRRPLEHVDMDGNLLILVDWVLEHQRRGSIVDTVDPQLRGEYVPDEASLVLKLGLLCTHPVPGARPGMRKVVQYLNGDIPAPDVAPANLRYGVLALMQKEVFDSDVRENPCDSSALSGVSAMSGLSGGR